MAQNRRWACCTRTPATPTRAVTGVALADGREVHAREVIVANALGAPALAGLPDGLKLPVRPVYGDILRLRCPTICAR